ncbi:hypothetical protein BGZ63DRAFT_468155 [Mariannaea sp. PMI_226]|nr:hypothetical protein BGZ63DRAFT_468155 [Mariannaea sp. PMI_226]
MMDRLNSKESLLVTAQTYKTVSDNAYGIKLILDGQQEQKKAEDSRNWRKKVVSFRLSPSHLPTWTVTTLDHRKNRLVEGTGNWLSEHDTFVSWTQSLSAEQNLFIIEEKSGSGKTSLMANGLRLLCTSYEAMTKSTAQIVDRHHTFDGNMDLWRNLFLDKKELHNQDTTFFIFLDGVDSDIQSFVPLLENPSSRTTLRKKVRICLTNQAQASTDRLISLHSIPFHKLRISDHNLVDVNHCICFQLDSKPVFKDSSRTDIRPWRNRILDTLFDKCEGDYFCINTILKRLSLVDLISDIETILAEASKTRIDQIDAEIQRLNDERTPAEIAEINTIIRWVIHRCVDWRTPEIKERIPKDDSGHGPDDGIAGQFNIIRDSEMQIVQHFLHTVSPPDLYRRFRFERFFAAKLGVRSKKNIHDDADNAHILYALDCLYILVSIEFPNNKELYIMAILSLLFHLKNVDLYRAERPLKE